MGFSEPEITKVAPGERVVVERAIAETVEVVSERLKFLEEENASRPELVKQAEAILARKGRRKRPKQKPTKSQVEILERLEIEGITPKQKPRSPRPAWWSKVEQLIVVLRRNLVKDAADKIENEINHEADGFYSWVTPKAVDEAGHYRESREAEENSARWLLKYLAKPWLANYISANPSEQDGTYREPPTGDGPVPPNAFRWNDMLSEGLQPIPWRLVKRLWDAENRTREIDWELGSVWDENEPPDDDAIGTARKNANAFFRKHGIPFLVAKKKRFIRLRDAPEMPRK